MENSLCVYISGRKDKFKSKTAIKRFKNKLKDTNGSLNLDNKSFFVDGYTYKINRDENKLLIEIIETKNEINNNNENRKKLKEKLRNLRRNRNGEYMREALEMKKNIPNSVLKSFANLNKNFDVPIPKPNEIMSNPEKYIDMIKSYSNNKNLSDNPQLNSRLNKYFKSLEDMLKLNSNDKDMTKKIGEMENMIGELNDNNNFGDLSNLTNELRKTLKLEKNCECCSGENNCDETETETETETEDEENHELEKETIEVAETVETVETETVEQVETETVETETVKTVKTVEAETVEAETVETETVEQVETVETETVKTVEAETVEAETVEAEKEETKLIEANPVEENIIEDKWEFLGNKFNWKRYLDNNKDLKKAGILNEEQSKIHWNNHGRFERRIKFSDSNKFNWNKYLEKNKDLQKVGLNNEKDLRSHWEKHGVYENRECN